MVMPNWWDRLDHLRERADMTTSDLAVWLDRPRATVDSWIRFGRQPIYDPPAKRKYLEGRIKLLEICVRKKFHMPMPLELRHQERADYLRRVYLAAHREFPIPRTRGRRPAVRHGDSKQRG